MWGTKPKQNMKAKTQAWKQGKTKVCYANKIKKQK